MELVLMLQWIVLVNYLTILFSNGGNGSFLSMPFEKTMSGGKNLEVFKTHRDVRSVVQCAEMCKENREVELQCHAFQYVLSEKRCDLYVKGTSLLPQPGVEIFMFETKGIFHPISIGDQLYSILLPCEEKNYTQARTHCNDRGGYLYEFESQEEYDVLRMLTVADEPGGVYVGINDMETEGQWVTDRGGTPIDTSVWKWYPGESTQVTVLENCAILSYTIMKLWDASCDVDRPFLCKRDTPLMLE